jgi:hypothetical protein
MKWVLPVGCGLVLLAGVLRADEPETRPSTPAATRPATKPVTKPAATRPSTQPATSRPARPGQKTPESKASDDALKTAILALTKEGQAAFKNKGARPPRSSSDYFSGKSPGIEPEGLLAVLTRQLSQDPRIDAYIKFQLLSAVEKFDAAHAKPAINALIAAPALLPLPGVGTKENQIWDRKSMNVKKEDIGKVNEELRTQRDAVDAINAPMIEYRNALKDKITTDDAMKAKLLQARVEELSQRAAAGYDTFSMWKDLATAIQTWSATASKKDVSQMVAFLQDYSKRSAPSVYKELRWSSPSARTQKAYWYDQPAILNEKRMSALIDALKIAAANAL